MPHEKYSFYLLEIKHFCFIRRFKPSKKAWALHYRDKAEREIVWKQLKCNPSTEIRLMFDFMRCCQLLWQSNDAINSKVLRLIQRLFVSRVTKTAVKLLLILDFVVIAPDTNGMKPFVTGVALHPIQNIIGVQQGLAFQRWALITSWKIKIFDH